MHTDRNATLRALAGVVTLWLLLVGCGGDDGAENDAEASPTTAAAAAASAATSTTPPDSTDASTIDAGGETGDFCELNDAIARLFGELAQTGSEETWAEIEAVVAQMPGAAPAGLEDDVADAMGYYPMARAELEAAEWDVSVLDTLELEPEHAAAEENITAYLDANC